MRGRQALAAKEYPLFYWASEHSSEIDYVLQKDAEIIGIEVKKGVKTRSRSLSVFSQKYSPAYTIRFSEKNFGLENHIRAIPHYASFCV